MNKSLELRLIGGFELIRSFHLVQEIDPVLTEVAELILNNTCAIVFLPSRVVVLV